MTRLLPLILLSSVFLFSHFAHAQAEAKTEAQESVPLEQLRLFSDVFEQIHRNYVKDISDKELLQYAIEGMLSRLDPHSAWLNKDDFLSLQESTNGEFAGIGVEVVEKNDQLEIVTPIDNSPAKRAGILAGDIIVKINNTPLQGLSLNDSIDLMRGKIGSEIQLTLSRQGKRLNVKLKREIIKIESVSSRLINTNYAYLRIAQFQKNTAEDAKKQLVDLNLKTLNGLIIDLRNNPGGLLNAAVALSDLFIKKGLIVYTQGRSQDANEKYFATGKAPYTKLPIVVLVNQGTASAAEIVSGALQDHRRALIIGSQTFGKGSVQTILPIDNEHGLKLTTALYYTPNGRSIQAKGISPDIIARNAELTIKPSTQRINEANLAHHLDEPEQADTDTENANKPNTVQDYPLHEAINILKALHLSQGKAL